MEDLNKRQFFSLLFLTSLITGMCTAVVVVALYERAAPPLTTTVQRIVERGDAKDKAPLPEEEAKNLEAAAFARDALISDIALRTSNSVVSVVATKDVPILEQYFINPTPNDDFLNQFLPGINFQVPQLRQKGTEKKQVSAGTGFFVSADGYILTNRHVVEDTDASYTVVMNSGKKLSAKVLARDPLKDIAVLKVDGSGFPALTLGDSDTIRLGHTAIAIGNALGEFQNTVSMGIISGLRRTLTASGSQSGPEELSGVIQTDAAINPGNSGGPLLNLRGEVIGLNTAIAEGAQSIGFAIPVNQIKKTLKDVQTSGRVIYPFLGVRHIPVTPAVKESYKLTVDQGALILKGAKGEAGVTPGSPADKAGLKEGDVIVALGGVKITEDTSLIGELQKHQVGEKVSVDIIRDGKPMTLSIVLEERR